MMMSQGKTFSHSFKPMRNGIRHEDNSYHTRDITRLSPVGDVRSEKMMFARDGDRVFGADSDN